MVVLRTTRAMLITLGNTNLSYADIMLPKILIGNVKARLNTKMIITGDLTQIDLPREQRSGLKEALKILDGVEGIGVVKLGQKDIVRHKLVTRIVNAYDKYDKERAEAREALKAEKDNSK